MTTGQLDQNLRRFYAEARTQKGEPYSKSTLLGFRHAIERYLNAPPYNKGLQVASDPRFMRSNQMLDAQLINLRRNGKENVTHKPAIEEGHLKQLQTSGVFSLSSPLSLLRNAWYHIVLFFCRRGSEGQRGLTTNSFKFATDAARRKFVTMAHDEASKTIQVVSMTLPVTRKKLGCTNQPKATMATRCLSSFLKRSTRSAVRFSSIRSQMLDLKNMMKKISKVAGFSTINTNHSIRVTAITLWSNAGVPDRHIMSMSGHRNEQSLAHYNSRPLISRLQNCSDVLSRALAVTGASYTVRVSRPSQQEGTSAPSNIAGEVAPFFKDCSIQNMQFVFNSSENHSKLTNCLSR